MTTKMARYAVVKFHLDHPKSTKETLAICGSSAVAQEKREEEIKKIPTEDRDQWIVTIEKAQGKSVATIRSGGKSFPKRKR